VERGWREALGLLPTGVASKLTLPAEALWQEWTDLPKTLIHGDTKVANFAFLPDGRVAAFDLTRLGAAPATLDLGWYLAVNSTRLARGRDELMARYRELLEARLGRALEEPLWERMMDACVVSGARLMLWSKALGLKEGTPFRRDDWAWWASNLTRWSSR
jgi:aminoglycoside phosphotransferase (APT) family kinase protein